MVTETCLIGHGIPSVSNDELVARWPQAVPLGMILDGEIRLLSMSEFVAFRGRNMSRFNYFTLDRVAKGACGYLTASGAMRVAELFNLRWAVSCGLGGIHPQVRGDGVCPDLYALNHCSVKLMATAFKDMMDYEATFAQLRAQGTRYRFLDSCVPGYIFKLDPPPFIEESRAGDCMGGLYLREIPVEKRISDLELLSRGIAYGHKAMRDGKPFHPEVNAYFDRETDGYSSRIQFEAILSNAEYLLREPSDL